MSLALSVTQSAPTCSEHDLVAAVRRGDDRAFEELYSRYRRRVGAYIYGMVADHGRAEDITQEVFISALRRMRESERPIAFKPWIYEIAKNACIDDFRRARRAREVPITAGDELEHDNPRLAAQAVTPQDEVESRQQLVDLRGAFRGLSETHHKIIVLRELEGLSYTEIGNQMGMSRPVVESTLFRARRRLSEEYDELVSGRRCDHVQAVMGERGGRAVRTLGIKERRLIARHLAHCQPCRRHAHLTGFDESRLQTPGVIGKIAALLPIPAFLRLRRGTAGARASRVVASRAHAFNAIQSVQSVATAVDPTGPFAGMGRVAAGAAALVIAGAGGGIVAGVAASSPHHRAITVSTGLATGFGAGSPIATSGARKTRATGGSLASAPAGARPGRPAAGVAAAALALPPPGASTSGAALRAGAGTPRAPGPLVPIKRLPSPLTGAAGVAAAAAGANPGSTAGSVAGGTVSTAGSGLSGVASGVGGVPSQVGGVASGVNSLLPSAPSVSLPSAPLPSAPLPSAPLPSAPVPSVPSGPGVPIPGKKGGSPNPLKDGVQSSLTVPAPDPSTVVAPLLSKPGLG